MPSSLPSQSFVNIEDIKNGIIYLKGGGLRRVLMVSGVNFDLKSEEEQEIILGGFQQFINTLDFSIQFSIHSRKVNTNRYLENIKHRKEEEKNDLLRVQITEYIDFVKSFVEDNPIISKEFFVVVPYEGPKSKAQKTSQKALSVGGGSKKEEVQKEPLEKSLEQLQYRVDQVVEGLEKMGLRTTKLETDELVELFYNLYNPELVEVEGDAIPKKYT